MNHPSLVKGQTDSYNDKLACSKRKLFLTIYLQNSNKVDCISKTPKTRKTLVRQ